MKIEAVATSERDRVTMTVTVTETRKFFVSSYGDINEITSNSTPASVLESMIADLQRLQAKLVREDVVDVR